MLGDLKRCIDGAESELTSARAILSHAMKNAEIARQSIVLLLRGSDDYALVDSALEALGAVLGPFPDGGYGTWHEHTEESRRSWLTRTIRTQFPRSCGLIEEVGMLTGFVETREKGPDGIENIWLTNEIWNADGQYVITVVVSVKEWSKEWRAYWRADAAESKESSRDWSEKCRLARIDACRRNGNKIPYRIALEMVPWVEKQFDVKWRP